MIFALTDFFQDGAFRVFTFERLPRGELNGRYWVKADLNLARRHGISLQELPLLCRDALEGGVTTCDAHTFTYTAEQMIRFAHQRAAEALAHPRKTYSPRPRST